MAGRNVKSHVPCISAVEHPMQQMALLMIEKRDVFVELAEKVRGLVKEHGLMQTPTLYDHAKLLELLGEKELKYYRGHVAEVLKQERSLKEVVREHPKAPYAATLYGRVEKDAPVLDVGSGDGKRLIQFEGQLNLKAIDQQPQDFKADYPFEVTKFEEPVEEVIVSFNSLTNNLNIKPFEDSDGIHIIPDLKQLRADGYSGRASKNWNEVYATHVSNVKDGVKVDHLYLDYDPKDLVSIPIKNYYRAANTYKKRAINISVLNRVEGVTVFKKLKSRGKRVMHRPFCMQEKTWKMPGELYHFRKKRGKAFMMDRMGWVHLLACDFEYDFDFILESFQEEWYLLEIDNYRNYRPFHSLALLDYFLNRVQLSVNGKPVKLPLLAEGDMPPWAEGIVYRSDGFDQLYRLHQSFDVTNEGLIELQEVLKEHGFVMDYS